MNHTYAIVLMMAAMTILLRFLPFVLLKFTKETPAIIVHLGNVLPQAAIGMLVVYCLRNVSLSDGGTLVATAIAALVAAALQWKFKNIVYTVIGSTAIYMILLHI